MAPRILLVGTSTPMQRLLLACGPDIGVRFVGLFTETQHASEVTRLAAQREIPLSEITLLKAPEAGSLVRSLEADWLFSVNSILLLPSPVLQAVRCGALNMHPGKLPEYAGLHTPQWAIRNGEPDCGVSLHWMEAAVDAGPIALATTVPITAKDTGLSLFVRCINAGAKLAAEALRMIGAGRELGRTPQDLSKRRVYRHRDALDGRFDWSWSTTRIWNHLRAADYRPFKCPTYTPQCTVAGVELLVHRAEMGALASTHPGELLRDDSTSVSVGTGDGGSIRLSLLARPGEAPMPAPRLLEATGIKLP